MRVVQRIVLAAPVAASLWAAGCGGSAAKPKATPVASAAATTTASAPVPVDSCGTAGGGWRPLSPRGGGAGIDAAVLGTGSPVVFLNDSGNDACDWMPLARRLAGQGRAAAVFSYRSADAIHEPDDVAEALAVARAAGPGKPFTLVGASLGGRVVFEAAARRPARLTSIVSLSGERLIQDYGDLLPFVERVRVPVLYVSDDEDALTDGRRQPRQIARALPARTHSRFLLLKGFEHGVELLSGADGARVTATVTRFVAGAAS